MPARRLRTVLHAARRSAAPDPTTLPDAHLLGRFLDHRDEAAFAALVRRHGPVVSAACRLAGLNPSDHDDVFQAAFLALVRQANSIRDGKSVGGWLFRIATRVAHKVRKRAGPVELPDDVPERTPAAPDADTHRVLDEEVAKLPEKYRLAVALVYLAGRNTTQAAAELGWAKGTVLTRLAWARERLRSQLLRRGVTLAAGAATVATVSPGVVAGVVRVCSQFLAGGVPAGASGVAVELSKGVVQDMALTKLKWAAGVLLVAAALTGVGLGRWGTGEANAQPDAKKPEARKKDKKPKPDAVPGLPPGVVPGTLLGASVGVTGDEPKKSKAETDSKPTAGFTVTKPLGTWAKDVVTDDDTSRVVLKIEDDRLTLTVETTAGKKGKHGVVVEADYAINGESTVFGVISSFDLNDPDGRMGANDVGVVGLLTGQPFAFRYRVGEGTLTVKEFKGFGFGLRDQSVDSWQFVHALCGRYAAVDPAKPNTGSVPKTTIKSGGGTNREAPIYTPPTILPVGPPVGDPLVAPPIQRQGDPVPRTEQLDNTPDELRPRRRDEKPGANARPNHLTPERIHGGT